MIFRDAGWDNPETMGAQDLEITAVTPTMGVPGGEACIHCRGYHPGLPDASRVLVGTIEASIITASEERVAVRLPQSPNSLGICLEVSGRTSPVFPFSLAVELASGLHPVANPVIAPDGTIITTRSGSRGQQVPQPLIRISPSGEKLPFPCEITNPTGLAFDAEGQLYITSRNDGTVLRYTDFEQLEVIAEDLGVASGIIFDSRGYMFVGDRGGKIYRISPSGERDEYASLEPSVSAYHFAMDSGDRLYVTGPTLSLRDPIYRIDAPGKVESVIQGLARPQGMAFLPDGELLVAASYGGKKGIFRYSSEKRSLSLYIAAPIMVGLAVAKDAIILANNSSVFRLQRDGAPTKVV